MFKIPWKLRFQCYFIRAGIFTLLKNQNYAVEWIAFTFESEHICKLTFFTQTFVDITSVRLIHEHNSSEFYEWFLSNDFSTYSMRTVKEWRAPLIYFKYESNNSNHKKETKSFHSNGTKRYTKAFLWISVWCILSLFSVFCFQFSQFTRSTVYTMLCECNESDALHILCLWMSWTLFKLAASRINAASNYKHFALSLYNHTV